MQDKIESLYQQYPKVLEVFDTEQAAELTKEECAALIKIMELTNQLTDTLRIVVPAGSQEEFVYTEEEVSTVRNSIKFHRHTMRKISGCVSGFCCFINGEQKNFCITQSITRPYFD